MERDTKLKISVIIPMYNASKTIVQALDSVKNQTYKCNYQILIANDGSEDNSQDVVGEYISKNPQMDITLINQPNGGVSSARNAGLKKAEGDYIAFLDSDDVWKENKIKEQINIFDNNNDVDFLGTSFAGFRVRGKKGQLSKIPFRNLLFRNYFQPSTILMKSNIIHEIGYFEEKQRYAEEGNYFLRVSRRFNCYFYNKDLIYFGNGKSGFGENGLSSNLKEMEKGELKNLRFAYKNKWIGVGTYCFAVCFSLLKYLRRVIIVKLR